MAERDLLKTTLAAGPECLSPQQLEAMATEERPAQPHLAQCPRCQAELALLKSFMTSEPLPDEGASVAWISAHLQRQRESIKGAGHSSARAGLRIQTGWLADLFRRPTIRWAVPMTAAVAAIVVLGITVLQRSKAPELQADLGQQPAIYRSQEVQLVSPMGEVAEVPQELRWQSVAGAGTYKVALMEIDYSPVWTGETKETSISIPARIRGKMLPGKPILWQITALDNQGQALATSQVQKFISP